MSNKFFLFLFFYILILQVVLFLTQNIFSLKKKEHLETREDISKNKSPKETSRLECLTVYLLPQEVSGGPMRAGLAAVAQKC